MFMRSHIPHQPSEKAGDRSGLRNNAYAGPECVTDMYS